MTETLKFVNLSTNSNPEFSDKGSSGFDLRAWITEEEGECITLKPLERRLIHTGLYFDIPKSKEIQIRPRSGLALKFGITVLNTPATIDSSYTGEIGIILINLSDKNFDVKNGDRIAQAVLCDVNNGYSIELKEVECISKKTERGSQGYGHSGIK